MKKLIPHRFRYLKIEQSSSEGEKRETKLSHKSMGESRQKKVLRTLTN